MCAAAAGLLLLSPLGAIIAFLIKLEDRGAILIHQTRVGLDGREFTMHKFRTMSEGAETGIGPVWSLRNDPRCTGVGTFLRRSGFDELPQLWNILRGDMSLVGPRPERPEFIRQFRRDLPGYDHRHSVRCGLTGYAQAHGWRGDTSMRERVLHDLYYVRHWSLALDLRILLQTALRGCSERTCRGTATHENARRASQPDRASGVRA